MKKIISAVSAAALTLSGIAAAVPTAQAADSVENIVLLGDSITSGDGLADSEYAYGELLADYLGAKVDNFAASGAESGDLKELVSTDKVSKALSDADVVVISIGANDMMHYASNALLQVAKAANCLKDEYASAVIPDAPTLGDVKNMIDKTKLKTFASDLTNKITISTELSRLTNNIGMTSDNKNASKYDRVIETKTIPNITATVTRIKELNPDAEIILETVYNPLVFEPTYFEKTYDSTYRTLLDNLVVKFDSVLTSYSVQLSGCAMENGAKVADVYTVFDSLDLNGARYTWYFDKMQDKNIDIHPNQAGNIAIAAEIINMLSTEGKVTLHDDNGALSTAYNSLPNKDSYPAGALATLKKVLGDPSKAPATYMLGDFNEDKMVDANDASGILEAYALLSTDSTKSLTDAQKLSGDVNTDKLVDSNDASIILSFYAATSTGYSKSIEDFVKEN
ncbi:MAG: hypothetical protein J5501_02930 [Ruminococcus sp.]|nr:hypothetical protein [Ruminococcus sp.]